ncbi:hypothetical protein Sme01_13900 [Sphaerisporangium melleum]|uniref:DUF1707 domain-containing protein n=1 Tax=Sphaerisporangium melleum TaxID=321316 RepID=A0A917QUR1_9ACTN|nr:DUF1707 domain-containing protein [Sphaerisporangium melleum]GGK68642.1 hypothetical protein GCM10007964_09500 [Sphaerisporangium melleum]GII68914.1 hypothetical protein Sme01_13900 [Sphaerisporangium melleum]
MEAERGVRYDRWNDRWQRQGAPVVRQILTGLLSARQQHTGPAPQELRASDDDRERVVTVLHEAVADGRLTPDEHEERVERVYTSRTLGELAALTADLLPEHLQPLRADGRPVMALFRSEQRDGRWVVPSHYPVTAVGTGVTLDLREALLQSSHITVQATVVGATLTLIVPQGVRVVIPASAVVGGKKNQVPIVTAPDAPVIEVTGVIMMGNVVAKSPKPPRRGWTRRRGS